MNICTLLICYGTNHPSLFSRLSKILLGSRKSLTPITSNWMRKGKEEQEEQGFMDLTESIDEFEVFDQPSSPKSLPEEMGIQRKP